MKIDITRILADHFRTLHGERKDVTSVGDLFLFYVFPLITAGLATQSNLSLTKDSYSLSITFFGIFVALLLNIQVAIFNIFLRKWPIEPDSRERDVQQRKLEERRALLSELNSNISYLTIVSCASLAIMLVLYAFNVSGALPVFMSTFLYLHFILTFLMIIKRSYVLFQKEYQ